MGKFPVDIYGAPARWILILAIPIAVMVTFPPSPRSGSSCPPGPATPSGCA